MRQAQDCRLCVRTAFLDQTSGAYALVNIRAAGKRMFHHPLVSAHLKMQSYCLHPLVFPRISGPDALGE
jgi:hypothetical protein